ncbi:purine-cytosine permease family protein [Acidiplasma aeolicum]|jgi:purine-cytosine permease-like protein|uniref:purine-cytosine permease family protein n=1 Tax=Acidiplasma aeolicum TaxID=507754 RepID=UPI0037241712
MNEDVFDTQVTEKHLEVIGVNPIPKESRTHSPGKIFNFWAMASASATTPLIGLLLAGTGLWNMVLVITIALVIGIIPAGLFSNMGRQIPLSALVVSRKTYGYWTSNGLSLLYTFVNLGWFGVNDATGGEILALLTHSSPVIWFIVIGILQILLVMFGLKWLEYFYRYTSILLIVVYAILTYYLITLFHVNFGALTAQTVPINWGIDINLVLAFSILSWTYKISTATRFAKPETRNEKKWTKIAYFIAAPIGIIVPVFLMGIIGYASNIYAGNWNLAAVSFPVKNTALLLLLGVAAFGASLAVIHTNAMNLYPSTVDLLAGIQPAFKKKQKEKLAQPVSTAILGVFGIILAIAGILTHIETFLNLIADLLFPYTFILIVDWYLNLRKTAKIRDFYTIPKTFSGNFIINAVLATVIGVLINFFGLGMLNPIFNYFPQQVFGSLVAALSYIILFYATNARYKPATEKEPESE